MASYTAKRINILKRVIGISFIAVLLSSRMVQSAEFLKISTTLESAEIVQEGIDEYTDPVYIIDYEKIYKNKVFEMYADINTGHFAVKDLRSNRIWYSTPNNSQLDERTKGRDRMAVRSQILVEYVFREDEVLTISPEIENSQSSCVANETVKVSKLANGIHVKYYFDGIGCMIPVNYIIRDDFIEASIDTKNIIEGEIVFITAIHLLPFFGAGDWDDEGYLVIPDGSGAVINFNNNINQTSKYSSAVFGDERTENLVKKTSSKQNVTMPVFGIVNNGDAIIGIVTEGEGASAIIASNGTETYGYNAVGSKLNYRTLSRMGIFKNDPKNHRELYRVSRICYGKDTYTVRYYSLSKGNANYTGIAHKYREYLIQEKGLKKQLNSPVFNLDLYGAFDNKSAFLGIPYTKVSPLTTFNQAQTILEDLREKGISDISVRYIGSENYGIFNKKVPIKFKPLSMLGGKQGLSFLQSYANEKNLSLFFDVDFIRYRSWGNGFSKNKSAVKSAFGETSVQYEYSRSVYTPVHNFKPYYLLKPDLIRYAAQKYVSSYVDYKFGVLGIASAGNIFTSDLDPKVGLFRDGVVDSFEKLYKELTKHKINLVFDNANSYSFIYAKKILNAPMFSSGYDIFDYDIPFYQIVLHGYVPLSTEPLMQSVEPQICFLKAVETGSELLYSGIYENADVLTDSQYNWLYSSTYRLWADDAAQKQLKYGALLKKICNSSISSHSQVSENVYKTVFENGVGVLVNYSNKTVIFDDFVVPPLDFTEIT